MRHRRSSWLLLFSASGLIAGWNDVKIVPVFPDFDSLGRNVYPRNVNETHSNSSLRLLSPQYTILVLSGCSRKPDALQPISQRRPHLPGLALCHTVHYRIISETAQIQRSE